MGTWERVRNVGLGSLTTPAPTLVVWSLPTERPLLAPMNGTEEARKRGPDECYILKVRTHSRGPWQSVLAVMWGLQPRATD